MCEDCRLIMSSFCYSLAAAAAESEENEQLRVAALRMTSTACYASLSLREMIELGE